MASIRDGDITLQLAELFGERVALQCCQTMQVLSFLQLHEQARRWQAFLIEKKYNAGM